MHIRTLIAVTCLTLAACPLLLASEPLETRRIALLGDTVYGIPAGIADPAFDAVLAQINSDPDVDWVLHAGDIKSGSRSCDDRMLKDRLARFGRIERPLIYTPGDNEWTDCHRRKAGGFQPLERLQRLRELFFPTPGTTLGRQPMPVRTQAEVPAFSEFPENVMWTASNVVFATAHVVGSHDGLKPFDGSSKARRSQRDDDEVARRQHAALRWIDLAFQRAHQTGAAGVMLMIHANPKLDGLIAKPSQKRARHRA